MNTKETWFLESNRGLCYYSCLYYRDCHRSLREPRSETASLKLDVVGLLFCSKRITQELKYKTSRSFSHGFFPCLCFSMSFPHAFFPCFFVTLLPCLHWKTVDPSSPDNMRQKGTVVAPHRHHRLRRD